MPTKTEWIDTAISRIKTLIWAFGIVLIGLSHVYDPNAVFIGVNDWDSESMVDEIDGRLAEWWVWYEVEWAEVPYLLIRQYIRDEVFAGVVRHVWLVMSILAEQLEAKNQVKDTMYQRQREHGSQADQMGDRIFEFFKERFARRKHVYKSSRQKSSSST